MVDRTKLLFCSLASLAVYLGGCSTTQQQSRFQMAFLPSAPRATVVAPELGEPPELPSNPYLADAHALVPVAPQLPPFSRGEAMIRSADQHLERGKRYYAAKNIENARKQFDLAVDLMLQASENNPYDRLDFERHFERMVESIHRYDLAGLGAATTVEDARFEKAPLEDILQMTFPVDPSLKNRVLEQVQATVSQLPLTVNDTVAGYIHYFSNRGRRTMLAGLERAGRYRPMIQRILDEEGLPPELIHLAQAESGFMPRAVSRAHATGMWQFVSFRGRQYGLNQTQYSDDRLDPEKATRAAARHLRDLFAEFGNWYLAIAAYNCGPGVIERAVERTGYADFWELRNRRVIPAETTNYVPIILAMTIMAKNAQEYGLDAVTPDSPLEYDTIEVTAPTHLGLVAEFTDAPVSELLALNPALLKGIAPAGYALRVPKGTAKAVMASLALIPGDRRLSWRIHKVAEGETLAAIAKRYGAAPGVIAAANGMATGDPVAGDRLVIPAVYREPVARPLAVRTSSGRRGTAQKTGAGAAKRAASSHVSTSRRTAPAKRTRPKTVAETAQNRP